MTNAQMPAARIFQDRKTPHADGSTREILLNAAAKLMLERDSIDVSLSDIARRSGLNSALIKYYFGNKDGMLLAMVRRAVGGSVAHLQEVVDMPIGPEDKIRLHVRGIVSSHHRHPYLNRLLHHMLSNEDDVYATTLSEELIRPVIEAQRCILEEGRKSGIFKFVDPMMFYFHLIGACEALFYGRPMLMRGFGIGLIDKDFKRSYADYLCDNILHGIMTAPPSSAGRRSV